MKTKVEKIIQDLIDIPAHKLLYVLEHSDLIEGMRKTFIRYGIEYDRDVHDTLVDMVGEKISGNPDIEFEWSETQYENFVKWKGNEE